MKVIVDKAERLLKMPQPALGAMKFTQKRLAARNVTTIDLESIIPELPDIELVRETLKKPYSPLPNTNASPDLLAQLKQKLFEKHHHIRAASPDSGDEIVITPGIRLTSSLVALGLLNHGETAAYPDPGAQHFRTAICLADGNPRRYLLSESNDYICNPSSLPGNSLKKARLLFINYPHNPTGTNVDYYFYNELLKFLKASNILIVADCAYIHPGDPDVAGPLQTKDACRKALELHSFSTTFGITELGFVAGHGGAIKILENILNAIGFTPQSSQVDLALACLEHADEIFAARMSQLQGRRELLADGLRKLGWSVRGGRLTPFLWAKVPNRSTSVAFARRLFAKAGIRVTPGSDFGEGGEHWLRLSLCCNENILTEALERLAQHSKIWQRKYRPEI